MILIDTALLSEAQSVIEKYKLKLIQKNPRVYQNDKIVLVITGIAKDNTIDNLKYILSQYKISKAINIGIAGTNDTDIKIGTLFCTNQKLENINYLELKTLNSAKTIFTDTKSYLYDMEAKYFIDIVSKYIDYQNIYVFKVVSDYLDDTIPSKEFVKSLIQKNIKSIEKWIY